MLLQRYGKKVELQIVGTHGSCVRIENRVGRATRVAS